MIKKTILSVAFALMAIGVFAQVITSKKGEPYLPQGGDWAISIDASSFLDYAGNFIGGNGTNEAPKFRFLGDNLTIVGKYFIDSLSAYRIGANIGLATNSTTTLVPSIPAVTPTNYVEDVSKNSATNIGLTFGKEWRKGKTRLQGYYGAEAGIAFSKNKMEWTYGNEISTNNPVSREREINFGSTLRFGIRGFIGAEYFILPKMALGGEFGWGLAYSMRGESTSTTESWSNNTVVARESKAGGYSAVSFNSDNLNAIFGSAGTIRLTLHF